MKPFNRSNGSKNPHLKVSESLRSFSHAQPPTAQSQVPSPLRLSRRRLGTRKLRSYYILLGVFLSRLELGKVTTRFYLAGSPPVYGFRLYLLSLSTITKMINRFQAWDLGCLQLPSAGFEPASWCSCTKLNMLN